MIEPNIPALKAIDGLKWDYLGSSPKIVKVFNFSGQTMPDEMRGIAQEIASDMQSIKAEAEVILQAAQSVING